MRIDETIERLDRPVFSFEFFPPKTDEGFANLRTTLDALRNDQPDFVSVTYGALGTTRDRTLDIVKWIKQDLDIEAMAHFTCVGATREELSETLREMARLGRGQRAGPARRLAQGEGRWRPAEGGLLLDRADRPPARRVRLAVGAAAFPEVHPEAESARSDLEFLKAKQDAGASFFVAQLFFDNEFFFDFVGQGARRGLTRADHPRRGARDLGADISASPSCPVRDPARV